MSASVGSVERFRYSEHGDAAVRLRNARARELRDLGFTVKCQTWNFTDLARDVSYQLEVTGQLRKLAKIVYQCPECKCEWTVNDDPNEWTYGHDCES